MKMMMILCSKCVLRLSTGEIQIKAANEIDCELASSCLSFDEKMIIVILTAVAFDLPIVKEMSFDSQLMKVK